MEFLVIFLAAGWSLGDIFLVGFGEQKLWDDESFGISFFSLEGGCCTKSQVNVFLDLTFSVFEKVE